MTTRTATCSCGQLRVTVEGDPVRVSVCHCLACQQRTGSAFGVQARWPRDRVRLEGETKVWQRTGDEGTVMDFHFCPHCGSTVWYARGPAADTIGVAVGAFADPKFPAPNFSVYEERRHPWVTLPDAVQRMF
ncbi:MAG TPA: GFA family protein [Rhizomicrobium sp.]|nr:GFA family protein [Rhizomicrobium sp.]